MLTAGEILKKERLRRNYSLEEIATATKIQRHYLEALEKNQFEKFPSSVYAKGFLQNYAKFLGVNSHRVLALYRRSVGEAPIQPVEKGPKPIKQPKFVLTPSIIIISLVSLFALATVAYLIYQFYNFQKPPFLEVTDPENNSTVTESEITLKGKTDPDMFVTVNDEAVKISQDGHFEVELSLSEGANTIIVKSRHPDNIGKEAVVTRNIEYVKESQDDTVEESETAPESRSSNDEQDSQESQSDIEGNTLKITISPEAAWIQVEIDGNQEIAAVVSPGTPIEYTFETSVYIITGKVSSTKVIVNGQERQLFIGEAGVASILCEIDNNDSLDCHQP
ncbi:helix-turn-helix domain-containing protein [Candidatus Dojkabacteria bacterium]|nr:helix-turn-helix domain-containing protein [Candidatus Dojkabacteria bacterium]